MPDDLRPGDGQDLLARFKQAVERRDPETMLELFAEDAEYRTDPFTTPLSGALAIHEHWNRVAAEQDAVDFDAERVWVAGRTVLASWHSAHTLRATAERVRERGFCTMELDPAGLITRMRAWPVTRVVHRDMAVGPPGAPHQAGEGYDGS
jgi:ketosteroid isomerase-like protein